MLMLNAICITYFQLLIFRNTSRNDFKFYADRLVNSHCNSYLLQTFFKTLFIKIRLVIEESLNQLPYTPCTVITPIGFPYDGLQFEKGNCGVSIVRSGEAMEQVRTNDWLANVFKSYK